ncbi:MAG: putative quinol monooxygenase [Parvibaculum sp.]
MIVVTGLIEISELDRDRAILLATELAQETRKETGCLSCGFYEDIGHPCRIRVYEEWESDEVLARHFTMPHMVRFAEGMGDMEIVAMDIQKFEAGPRSPI